ncbi:hypothetical protein, partial [Leptospira mayottensis]
VGPLLEPEPTLDPVLESELPPVFVFVSLAEEELPVLAFVLPPVEDPELSLEPDPALELELPTFVFALVSVEGSPALVFVLPPTEDPELLEPEPTLDPVLESELPPVFVFTSLPELELLL